MTGPPRDNVRTIVARIDTADTDEAALIELHAEIAAREDIQPRVKHDLLSTVEDRLWPIQSAREDFDERAWIAWSLKADPFAREADYSKLPGTAQVVFSLRFLGAS